MEMAAEQSIYNRMKGHGYQEMGVLYLLSWQ